MVSRPRNQANAAIPAPAPSSQLPLVSPSYLIVSPCQLLSSVLVSRESALHCLASHLFAQLLQPPCSNPRPRMFPSTEHPFPFLCEALVLSCHSSVTIFYSRRCRVAVGLPAVHIPPPSWPFDCLLRLPRPSHLRHTASAVQYPACILATELDGGPEEASGRILAMWAPTIQPATPCCPLTHAKSIPSIDAVPPAEPCLCMSVPRFPCIFHMPSISLLPVSLLLVCSALMHGACPPCRVLLLLSTRDGCRL